MEKFLYANRESPFLHTNCTSSLVGDVKDLWRISDASLCYDIWSTSSKLILALYSHLKIENKEFEWNILLHADKLSDF